MIIGISGKAQSGKDSVGKIIQYLTFINDNEENENCKILINNIYFGKIE